MASVPALIPAPASCLLVNRAMSFHAPGTAVFLTMILMVGGVFAAEPNDPQQLAWRIDQQIDQQLPAGSQTSLLSESAFLRRVTLDLAGRIPTATELQRFRESESLNKRRELVERLIDSPDFAFHQRNELDTLLLRRLTKDQAWRDYLLEATRENRPWDRMFREIMSPEDHCPEDVRPVAFIKQRVSDLDSMANDTSVLWFGVNIGCAKCHDHPLVDDWKQAHYYGLASFFKRTYSTKKGFLGERFNGDIQYQTTDGEQFDADFMFLTGATVKDTEEAIDKDVLKQYEEAIKKAERENESDPPPRPGFRPRSQLVDLALSDSQHGFFPKNIVNRVWARMLGRGLIHPLDQMHSGNPPSHPELLEMLSQDLVEHQYDLRRLIHAIALSDTYARSLYTSDSDSDSDSDSERPSEPPPVDLFGSGVPRPLTPHQLSLSLIMATRSPVRLQQIMDDGNWATERDSLERQSENVAQQIEIPSESFQVPVAEALWFSNNQQVQNEYLNEGNDRLVGYLSQIESNEQLIRAATRSVLSRDPIDEELEAMSHYLDQRADRRTESIKHLVWALLGSPEFRFNH